MIRFTCLVALLLAIPGLHAAPAPPPAPDEVYSKLPDPPVDPAMQKALYAVGYAHLDTQWRWSYPQVVREFVRNTLEDNFKLFEKYPNYVFNFSGSRRYEMMREYYPDDYAKLKDYVKTGRWFPCGSSVDEADANVPGLESFVRQVLYGNRYFEQEFGQASAEFMLPDCFGFPASLPSVLAHCGIQGFSTQKLTWGSANGIPFKVGVWTGPDGKSVTAALDPGAYTGNVTEDLSQSQGWLKRIENTGAKSGAYVDYHYFGTGDRGGAPGENSVKWLEHSLKSNGPVRVVSATAERMFNDLKPEQIAKLPTYKGELLLTEHSSGSITSQAYMKRWNRKNELLADAAERASVGAMLLGGAPYPSRKLYEGWDLLLGSQMHDMLPGTSLPKAYEYCWNDEILAANHFAAVETDAVGAIAGVMDTTAPEGSVPLVIYNPLAQQRGDLVEATITLADDTMNDVQVFNDKGRPVETQVLSQNGQQAKILFAARVPALGFATYTAQGKTIIAKAENQTVSTSKLENFRYRVSIDQGGDISSIFDKKNNEELLAGPARLEFHYENPRQFPAWNMDWSDRQKPAIGYVDGPAKVRVVENGPARVAVEIEREARGSKFVQTIRLGNDPETARVEIFNVIDWQSQECCLKAAFPFKNANPQAAYDDKVGVVMRGNNDPKKYEVPQHQWFDLTGADGRYGVAVLNDSKFGSDKPDDKTMRLTLLYTPGVRGGYQDQATQDFGRHEILYAIAGHKGDWREGNVPAQAARLNQPLAAFQTAAHPGKLGRSFSMLKVNSNQVEIAALKKAEASDEIVIRLRELNGTKAENVEVAAGLPVATAREINGQEKPVGPAMVRDGKLVTSLEPFGLKAFAVTLTEVPVQAQPVRSQPVTLAFDADAVSSQKNRADGGFDTDGVTYPAEQFPKTLQSEGVDFQLGPTADGQKNAMICRGQTIDLPEGDYNRVYLLAAAHNGDTPGNFKLGDRVTGTIVQDWSGFVGQWDNRQWAGNVPELTYSWNNQMNGLVPGFIKRDTVAWYASHRHHPQDGIEFYKYCYLFKYGFDLPAGVRKLILPDNAKIGVFAVSVARTDHDVTTPARPLYDTLDSHVGADKPLLSPAGGSSHDALLVKLEHPLYWREGGLHYTTDGSEPTAESPVYQDGFRLSRPTTVRARSIGADGKPGPESTARYEVNDTTPPRVLSATALENVPQVNLRFSEPLERTSAENPANYAVGLDGKVVSAKLAEDGCGVLLTLAQPLEDGANLVVNRVSDQAEQPNFVVPEAIKIASSSPVFTLDQFVSDGSESKKIDLPRLPTGGQAPWTVNFFLKTDKRPENRTLFAGFGAAKDEEGRGRYLGKFANGVHFWCSDQDVETTAPVAVGRWQMLSASFDGHILTVYQDGRKIGQDSIELKDDDAVVEIAPLDPWEHRLRFVGEIRGLNVWGSALGEEALQSLNARHP